jgi:hypothetical protein
VKRVLIGFVLATTTAFGLQAASAGPLSPGTLVQVSGVSPFLSCTADDVGGQSGTVYLNSEVEPWIDVNPTDQQNMIGIFQQDRWSNGGARGLVARVTFDGGTSWQESVIPGIVECSGGIYDRSTDPWVSYSPDGTAHQLALSFNDLQAPFVEGEDGDFDHALLASKSTDGGKTWSAPVEVIRDLDANVFNDKQTITADPHDPDFVYAAWDRLVFPTSERASIISGLVTNSFRGPFWFARSTDGGKTWEPARQIFDPGQQSQTIGNQIVVLPNGDLVNIFDLIRTGNRTGLQGLNVAVLRSTNRGETWSQTPIIVSKLGTIAITDPETGDDVRTGDIIPDVAVDPTSGRLYAVWQDARFNANQADAIAFSQSLDGGFTWSNPIKINKTPTNIAIGNQQAFTPSVHVASNGAIGVTYYDFRKNTSATPLLTDYFIVHCHPASATACTRAANWTGEKKLTNVSFDMRQAPNALGFFTGDYEGLAAAGTTFVPFFSQPHGNDPSSTFFRRVAQ